MAPLSLRLKTRRLGATQAVRFARSAWNRDQGLPSAVKMRKASDFVRSLLFGSLYLRRVDETGSGLRCLGRPRITNDGFMKLGTGSVLRSHIVPVELVSGPGGRLEIGRFAVINTGVSIAAHGQITIGDRALIGPYVMINDTAYHDVHERGVAPAPQPIVIEDDVWLGAKATVLPGVRIGRGAVVSAHALVTKDVPEFTIVSGVPAQVVAKLNSKKFAVAAEQVVGWEKGSS